MALIIAHLSRRLTVPLMILFVGEIPSFFAPLVALDRLPSFATLPRPGPHLACTIHLGCETMASLHDAYLDAECGRASTVPLVEMTIPSVLDSTLAPPGKHVASLFVQYTPYAATWTDETKNAFADRGLTKIQYIYQPYRLSL